MIEMFKISHSLYDPEICEEFITFSSDDDNHYNLRRHAFTFYKDKFNTKIRRHYFKCRVVDSWNNLPTSVAEAPSLNAFKCRLDKLWRIDDIMFDGECNLRNITSSRQTRYR